MGQAIVTKIQTRMSDYDVLGHINNVSYLNFLEVARIRAFGEVMGVDLTAYSGLTTRTEIKYVRPAPYGVPIAVEMTVTAIGMKTCSLAMRVIDERDPDQIFAKASIDQITYDVKAGRTCKHPPELRAQLEALMPVPGATSEAA